MSKKTILILGICTYFTLLFFSILFYKERIAFTDGAHHLFFILKDGNYSIQNYRFVALFTQSFPVIASKLNASLNTVTILYSISFVLLHFFVFLLILLGLKNEKVALVCLLFSTLMIRHSFYWPLSEAVQGIVVSFIYVGILYNSFQRGKASFWEQFLMLLLILIVAFSHPLQIFLFPFLIAFTALHFKQYRILLVHSICYGAFFLIKAIVFKTENDQSSGGTFLSGLKLFPNYFNLQSNYNFLEFCKNDYQLLIIFLIVSVVFYCYKKLWLKAALVLSFFLACLFVNNISKPEGLDQFYIEGRYIYMSVFVIFPIVFDILPAIKNIKFPNWIIGISLASSLVLIYDAHTVFTKRLNWQRKFLAETKSLSNNKLIIPLSKAPKNILFLTWGTPYEFWLISTLEGKDTRSILVNEKDIDINTGLTRKNVFQTTWGAYEYKEFPKRYFHFSDSTSTYVFY